jgi:hypothetical protein
MPRAAPTNNENRGATVHRCNAKAWYSGLFSWNFFQSKLIAESEKGFFQNDIINSVWVFDPCGISCLYSLRVRV